MIWEGKKRSRFGKWIDQHSINQEDLARISGVNRATISRLSNDDENTSSVKNSIKLLKSLREMTGEHVTFEEFWG